MATRARNFLIAAIVAIPCFAYSCPAAAHNGRDGAPPKSLKPMAGDDKHRLIDIYEGIEVRVDPKSGIRSYTQVGDIPANNGSGRAGAFASTGPGIDWWVEKSLAGNDGRDSAVAPSSYNAPQESRVEMYDEGYYGYGYGYGGYYPSYGGGGRHDRPGRGHGGGGGRPDRPDRPGHGGGGAPDDISIRHQPGSRWSPPPGPEGGGVGSPSPYPNPGVGAPVPLRYNSFRGGRRS